LKRPERIPHTEDETGSAEDGDQPAQPVPDCPPGQCVPDGGGHECHGQGCCRGENEESHHALDPTRGPANQEHSDTSRAADSVKQPYAECRDGRAAELVGMGMDMLCGVSLTASRMVVGVGVNVSDSVMAVRMHVEIPPVPAEQEPYGKQYDQESNDPFRTPLEGFR
jgi:hypothetical protein